MLEVTSKDKVAGARIVVAGIGGAGGNAINRMIDENISNVEFVCINTDMQALSNSKASKIVQIGEKTTKGLGAGADPSVGEKAAEESLDEITQSFEGADMLFVTCGMGGGTGTGAAPIIAKQAKDRGILTVAVVTKPFKFERGDRMKNALQGIAKLSECVDTMIVIPNEKILAIVDKKTSIQDAFKMADEVLRQSVSGITDLITTNSMINLDFADVRTVMKDKGIAYVGIGKGKGEDKASDAVKMAVESPLLEASVDGATHLIVSVSGDISMYDASVATEYVTELAGDNVKCIFGADYSVTEPDTCTVTVIATGIRDDSMPSKMTSTQNVMFNSSLVRPAPIPSFGQRQQGLVQPSGLDVLQNRSTGTLPKVPSSNVQPQAPSQGYAPGITSAADIRSNVKDNKLNIPTFLKK